MPDLREGRTHHIKLEVETGGDIDLYVHMNKNADGEVAEIFANIGLQGSTLQGMLDGWCILASIALQYGVPMQTIVDKFTGQQFPPAGSAISSGVTKTCKSLLDLLAQLLDRESSGAVPG